MEIGLLGLKLRFMYTEDLRVLNVRSPHQGQKDVLRVLPCNKSHS
jgi:hypothetical protein